MFIASFRFNSERLLFLSTMTSLSTCITWPLRVGLVTSSTFPPPFMPVKHSSPEPCPQPLAFQYSLPTPTQFQAGLEILTFWPLLFRDLTQACGIILISSQVSLFPQCSTSKLQSLSYYPFSSTLPLTWGTSLLYNQHCIFHGHCIKLEALCPQGLCIIPFIFQAESHIQLVRTTSQKPFV